MRVSRLAIGVAVLLVSPSVFGQEQEAACDMDLDEFTNNAPAFGDFVDTGHSANARTLRDFRNAAVNYFFHDADGSRLLGYLGGAGQIRIPICNELGQCVQAEAEIRFENNGSLGISPLGVDISVDIGVGIDGYDISVEDAGGNRITYPADKNQRVLRMPASGPPGGLLYQDQTCRNNDHTAQDSAHQNEEGQPSPASGDSGGGGGGDLGDAYGGAYPIGGTFVHGGGGGTGGDCWVFTARDREGNFISAYAICF